MQQRTRWWLTGIVVVVIAVVGIVVLNVRSSPAPGRVDAQSQVAVDSLPGDSAPPGEVVRESSRRLNTVPDSDVTFVEFLDFECEGCRALFPVVEQLRSDYGDRVNFVIRYFPLPGHVNSERAARAVEAAAQQGKLEDMYKKMYETQQSWGEQRVPADAVFRGFASDMGLDMTAYDAVYSDPATTARVQLDVADGKALGVVGTPSFFVDGTRIQPRSYQDLTDALDKALAA
ncbi:MAG: thioredoxin domain-containing protein [Mycobacterium kyogaense]|uniref:DsbA family protein n=1 Tax=Mycobacterium kyogaense TaxID=2212479 RepID=UPI002FF496FB